MADPAEIEMLRQMLLQEGAILPPQRVPRPGDPGLPPNGMTVARSQLSPSADALMGATGLPVGAGPALSVVTDVGQAFGQQPDVMGRALAEAEYDPTIPKVTNAALQTALAAGRPGLAVGSVGAGLGAGLLDDLGAFDSSAQAQKLTKDQRREMEMERQRSEREAKRERERAETDSRLRRDEAEDKRQGELKAQGAKQDLAERNRAIEASEEAFKREMARDRRFSDTTVGKTWDATGGFGPAAMGFFGAKLARAGTGPGQTIGGKIWKDYTLPIVSGTAAGAVSSGAPLAYNALNTEPDNPKKRAYEARAEALPPDHKRRQEFFDYAKSLPDENPVRKAAQDEFYDEQKLKERFGIGALEGFAGSLLGTDLVSALGRGYNALRGGPPGPGGPSTADLVKALERHPGPAARAAPAPQAAQPQRKPHWESQPRGQPGNPGQWKKS